MGNYLVEVEKDEKEDMIHKLSGELIEIGVQLNRDVLCRICGGKHMMSRLSNMLNELNDGNDLIVGITDLSNGLLGTLKKIENCTSCKDNIGKCYYNYSYGVYKSIRETKNYLVELEKGEKGKKEKEDIIYDLNNQLIHIDDELNGKLLCEGCKEKKETELIEQCGNKEIAGFLHECRLKSYYKRNYVRWIPFNRFRKIEYLTKGGFGEIHKATWTNLRYYDVVLKKLYKSSNKILDILKEVKI